jgi:hypothetical protein
VERLLVWISMMRARRMIFVGRAVGARRVFRVPDRGSGNPTPLGGWMAALPV